MVAVLVDPRSPSVGEGHAAAATIDVVDVVDQGTDARQRPSSVCCRVFPNTILSSLPFRPYFPAFLSDIATMWLIGNFRQDLDDSPYKKF